MLQPTNLQEKTDESYYYKYLEKPKAYNKKKHKEEPTTYNKKMEIYNVQIYYFLFFRIGATLSIVHQNYQNGKGKVRSSTIFLKPRVLGPAASSSTSSQ